MTRAEQPGHHHARERPTSARLAAEPWPGSDWPTERTRYVVTTHDRFLPAALQRRVALEHLGIGTPAAVACGHCAALARPVEVAALLVGLTRD